MPVYRKGYYEPIYLSEAERNVETRLRYKKASFFKKQIVSRGVHLGAAGVYFAKLSAKTAKGLGRGTYSVATGLKDRKVMQQASNEIQYSNRLLNLPFAHLLKAINPNAQVGLASRGIITSNFMTPLSRKAAAYTNKHSESTSFWSKHVVTRINYAAIGVASIVARLADLALGLVSGAFALLTLGLSAKLNHFAYCNLTGTGLISDLANTGFSIINPYRSPSFNEAVWETFPQNDF